MAAASASVRTTRSIRTSSSSGRPRPPQVPRAPDAHGCLHNDSGVGGRRALARVAVQRQLAESRATSSTHPALNTPARRVKGSPRTCHARSTLGSTHPVALLPPLKSTQLSLARHAQHTHLSRADELSGGSQGVQPHNPRKSLSLEGTTYAPTRLPMESRSAESVIVRMARLLLSGQCAASPIPTSVLCGPSAHPQQAAFLALSAQASQASGTQSAKCSCANES